jgi:predicted transcriptional regulator
MMKNRSRIDIIREILEAANGRRATKTTMTYNASISYTQSNEFVTLLIEKDLLSYDLDTRTFMTSEKGHRVLQMYNQIGNMITKGGGEEEQSSKRQQMRLQHRIRRQYYCYRQM